ncbi:MAG: hypothetical protein ACHQ49_08515 [Elusimicrobiota bacterium]
MTHFHRNAIVKCAAGLGLSALVFFVIFGLTSDAPARNREFPDSPVNTMSSRNPESVIQEWPKAARLAAAAMIEKYGEPSRFTKSALIWNDNSPWLETIVYDPRSLRQRSRDIVEQSIAYRVPLTEIDALKLFDSRLEVRAISGRIAARTDGEPRNFLLVNLADEIMTGARGVENARAFYRKTEDLAEAGKSSPYMTRFVFPRRDGVWINGGPASP